MSYDETLKTLDEQVRRSVSSFAALKEANEQLNAAEAEVLDRAIELASDGFHTVANKMKGANGGEYPVVELDRRGNAGNQRVLYLTGVPEPHRGVMLNEQLPGGAWRALTPFEAMATYELRPCLQNLLHAFSNNVAREVVAKARADRASALRALLGLLDAIKGPR